MRIAIVNDTVIAIEALRRVLTSVPDYEVAWIARDGMQAVAKCAVDTPDLILMDMIMPIMDGVEATRQIMNRSPCAILVVTNSMRRNSAKVFEAMGYGALDVVNTPVLGTQGQPESAQALLNKIATISTLVGKPPQKSLSGSDSNLLSKRKPGNLSPLCRQTGGFAPTPPLLLPSVIAIGASTGGPKALATILSQLPTHFPAAFVIIQHVDVQFVTGLVKWLNEQTPLSVLLASEGERLEPGKVWLAGTNDHLVLRPNLTLGYTKEPRDYPYRPSVDVFFKSVAQHWNRKGIAILLTGMGRDGAEGLNLLRSKGWHTIAQDRGSSVVYGMPKAAVELNAAVEVLPLEAIASTLMRTLSS